MTDFSLEIQIDQTGLQNISSAGLSVALLQPQGQSDYQVVALLTSASNTIYITWTDDVSVYTSSYSLQAYSTLKINAYVPAISGQAFTFDGVTINQTSSTSLPDSIQLTNTSGHTVTSGLAKIFDINGQPQNLAITTASSVLNNGQGSFPIINQIMLTLIGGASLGMVIPNQVIPNFQPEQQSKLIPQITAQPALTLDFTTGNATQVVHFDDQANEFVVGALPS